jgi:hypothetical protein
MVVEKVGKVAKDETKIGESLKNDVLSLLREGKKKREISKLLRISRFEVTAFSQGLSVTGYELMLITKRGYHKYSDYQKELAQGKRFNTLGDYQKHRVKSRKFKNRLAYDKYLAERGKFKSVSDYRRHFIEKREFRNWSEYQNYRLKERGFSNQKEYEYYLDELVSNIIIPILLKHDYITPDFISKLIEKEYGFKFSKRTIVQKLTKEKESIDKKYVLTIDNIDGYVIISLQLRKIFDH